MKPIRWVLGIVAAAAKTIDPFLDLAFALVPFRDQMRDTGKARRNESSWSPVLNARGELCGLPFDGTYDTVTSDVLYDPVRTRSINFDSRYLLWVLTEVDGATRLLQALGR